MTGDLWTDAFFQLARHLPGLGGPQGFDSLTLEEMRVLLRRVKEALDRQAAALSR